MTTTAQASVVTSTDGVAIHYDVRGSGATALVFVHGWCCDRSQWRHQVDDFSASHTVVTVDLAGHGASGHDRSAWSIQAFGEDVVAVVRHLELKRVVLVGHSMGGSVIVEAARHLNTTVVGLVGVETWRDMQQTLPPPVIAAVLAPFRANFTESSRAFVRTMFLPTSDPSLVAEMETTISQAPADIAIASVEALFGHTPALQEHLQALEVPKITINAADWKPTDLQLARKYGIEVLPISGVGHWAMLEDPQTFNRLLEKTVQKMSEHR